VPWIVAVNGHGAENVGVSSFTIGFSTSSTAVACTGVESVPVASSAATVSVHCAAMVPSWFVTFGASASRSTAASEPALLAPCGLVNVVAGPAHSVSSRSEYRKPSGVATTAAFLRAFAAPPDAITRVRRRVPAGRRTSTVPSCDAACSIAGGGTVRVGNTGTPPVAAPMGTSASTNRGDETMRHASIRWAASGDGSTTPPGLAYQSSPSATSISRSAPWPTRASGRVAIHAGSGCRGPAPRHPMRINGAIRSGQPSPSTSSIITGGWSLQALSRRNLTVASRAGCGAQPAGWSCASSIFTRPSVRRDSLSTATPDVEGSPIDRSSTTEVPGAPSGPSRVPRRAVPSVANGVTRQWSVGSTTVSPADVDKTASFLPSPSISITAGTFACGWTAAASRPVVGRSWIVFMSARRIARM
jgi:hypothetical protein